MRSLLAGALIACSLAAPAFAAEFKKSYAVEGSAPGGGGEYSGTVTVTPTGDAVYQVVWKIGDQKFVGTGIGGPEGLAVGYKSGSDTGIAIYRLSDSGDVEGYWTYAGGKQIGQEKWTSK